MLFSLLHVTHPHLQQVRAWRRSRAAEARLLLHGTAKACKVAAGKAKMERKRHRDEVAWERQRKESRDLVDRLVRPFKQEAGRLIAKIKLHATAWKLVDDAMERAQGRSVAGARHQQRRARGAELWQRQQRWSRMSTRVLTDEAIARAQAKCRASRGNR